MADGRVGGRFHGPAGCLGSGAGGQGRSGQVGANASPNAVASSEAQGQVPGILILRLRRPRTIRAAVCSLDGGRSIRDVARELGVNHETLRNWVEQLRRERRDGPAAVGGEERAELARLPRRVAELELEREVLRTARSFRPGDRPVTRETIYGFIAAEKTTYPVRLPCRVL